MSIGTIILIILIIALLGGFSGIGGGPFYGTGYYGGGGLGLVIVILLILILMGQNLAFAFHSPRFGGANDFGMVFSRGLCTSLATPASAPRHHRQLPCDNLGDSPRGNHAVHRDKS